MSQIRAKLTFANVTSLLALFVALGGTATAALLVTGKNVRNGSLTGIDIRNNSLASADIKDGGLLAADFKAGQLAAGAKGDPGAKGDTGVSGAKGDTGGPGAKGDSGERGARGPSDGYAGTTATLEGPGKYLLIGRGFSQNFSGSTATLNCQFDVSGFTEGSNQTFPGFATVPNNGQISVPVLGWAEVDVGTATASLNCTGEGAGGTVMAIKVENLHK